MGLQLLFIQSKSGREKYQVPERIFSLDKYIKQLETEQAPDALPFRRFKEAKFPTFKRIKRKG